MNVWQFSLRDGDGEKLFFNWIAWRVNGDVSIEGWKRVVMVMCVCVCEYIATLCFAMPKIFIPIYWFRIVFCCSFSLQPFLALHDDISHVPTHTIWALGILLAFLMPQRQIARVWLRFLFFSLLSCHCSSHKMISLGFMQKKNWKTSSFKMPNSIHSTHTHTKCHYHFYRHQIEFFLPSMNFHQFNLSRSFLLFFFHQQYWVSSAEKNLGNWVMRMCVLFYFASAACFQIIMIRSMRERRWSFFANWESEIENRKILMRENLTNLTQNQ